mgnify:CR=1 FL=1|jgi:hypothetical protein
MNSCTICMKEDITDENIYTTDCKHMFCNECLDDWFQRGNKTCPLCRSEINTYIYKDENYKLIIHNIESNNQTDQISLTDLVNHNLVVRNIVKHNIRLRFYSLVMSFMFLYMLNSYLYSLQNINIITNELNTCNLNNTHLQDVLNECKITIPHGGYIGAGYYVSMYNGELSRRCFYPLNFYNICFNK